MRILTIAVLLALCGIACTMRKPNSPLTGESLLPSSFYVIDPARDTTITTAQGARLTIPAGALGDSTVQLEVKEAYTIADMIRGGLTTTTHGVPLSSGGMIYINALGAAPMKFRKPIKVEIPTKGLQEGMQLFKGVKNEMGKIDWVDPAPLAKTRADSDLVMGKALFTSNCASCHGIGGAVTGPALGWICDREPDKEWLHDFIHNNNKVLRGNDPYGCYLFNLYNKTPMNVFPDLTDKDIDMLLSYIMNASQVIDSNTVPNNRKAFDSCVRYSRLTGALVRKQKRKPAPLPPPPVVKSANDPTMYSYLFYIDASGWYNCDILLEGMDGVAESELWVRVKGVHRQHPIVCLVVPGVKVLMQGEEVPDKKDVYAFHGTDGKMLLPQRQPAFILCMGDDNGVPFWGEVQWTIGLSQELTVDPVATSSGAIDTAIAQFHFGQDTARHVTDSGLKVVSGLKPKFCDCDCHLK